MRVLTGLLLASAAMAADGAAAANLEAHAFASFGYLRTWRNNWLGDTTGGSVDMWEAAANVIARPVDRLRVGAQLFARDLVRYDNGRPQLDWAYADVRAADWFGIQAGRIKFPLGLANEILDVDIARTPVFQPPGIYALRSRDLYVSTDGAKIYGSVAMAGAGSLDYAVFAGTKRFDNRGGFATYLGDLGFGEQVDRIRIEWNAGGMLHWNTPIDGLAVRATIADIHGLSIDGSFPSVGVTSHASFDDYIEGVVSVVHEGGAVTTVAEVARLYGRGTTRLEPMGSVIEITDDSCTGTLNATWHAASWLDAYGGVEASWLSPAERRHRYVYTWVAALCAMPTPHWSVKGEFRDNTGTMGANAVENPGGIRRRWQAVAFKTTVEY